MLLLDSRLTEPNDAVRQTHYDSIDWASRHDPPARAARSAKVVCANA